VTPADATSDVLLSARGIEARAGGRVLFSGLDLDVRRGELVALTGPNGAGKSTLLRILLGLSSPASGHVVLHEGTSVGYVPQLDPGDPGHPFPALSVVEQGLSGSPWTPRRWIGSRRAARAALDRVGFRVPPTRRYTHLSGGERRRVLLARALVGRRGLLALDEPTAGVDVEGEQEVERIVWSEVRDRGAGAIWVCHGLSSVEREATRVVRLGGASWAV